MAYVKTYEVQRLKEPYYANLPEEENTVIVETAGFIPLDVKFKRFEQAGIAAQFQHNEFTANDFRELYANPDFEIYPDDELEDVEEKISALQRFQAEYIRNKKLGDSGKESPSQQAERASKTETPPADTESESE